MRLDKYLKVSRIFKRRTVAKDISDHDRVLINNKVAKPSTEVKPNDIITIVYGTKTLRIKVLAVFDSSKKADAEKMYEVIDEIRHENSANPELPNK